MIPPFHFLASLVLCAVLYPFYGINSFFVIVSGFLIDLDHYLWYVYKFKNFNFIKAYKFYLKINKEKSFAKQKKCIIIFHSVEFLILMVILSFYSKIMFIILIGLLYHYVLDIIHVLFIMKGTWAVYSIIWWFVKHKE